MVVVTTDSVEATGATDEGEEDSLCLCSEAVNGQWWCIQ